MKYLLDTNICIYFLKGKYGLVEKIDKIGFENLYISEITIAELKFGASAIANQLTLVTNNEKHFDRLTNIQIENWTK